MYRKVLFRAIPLIALAIVGGWLVRGAVMAQSQDSPEQTLSVQSSANLLVNGSMEGDYRWRYPNHYVAPLWIRWWIHGSDLPEYDLTRGSRSYVYYDGERAQVYFIWGKTYTAGIYQVVTGLTPCVPYRLTAWARNHSLESALPHARIGLDPQGTQLTPDTYDCAVKTGLPPLTVWSREQTALFTWEELSVEAEPLGDRLTAILYASPWHPNDGHVYYFDTFWDAASLTQVGFPNNRLPAPGSWTPSGFITNVVTQSTSGGLVVQWDTLGPASTQVWYNVITPTAPITPTGAFTVYLPLVSKSTTNYVFATTLDTTPTTTHQATIPLSGLPSGTRVEFVLLSRRPLASACATEVYGPLVIIIE